MFGVADIRLRSTDRIYDINFVAGDFELTRGLDTAIQMSLTCERRAVESEVKLPQYRRGWLGNEINGFDNFEYGSKNWFLEQARATQNTLNNAVTYSQQALQWLVIDNYANSIVVSGEYDVDLNLLLRIQFVRNDDVVDTRIFNLWQNTFVDGVF
jgi:phage gp46-like protein